MASQQNSGQLSFRARVPVFDANIGVGHCHDRPSPFADVAGLRAEMQRHGVERGLIYHLQGETLSAIEGNEALRAWLGDGLVPQWVAGPSADSLAQLRALHAAGEVRSVRLHNTEASRVPLPTGSTASCSLGWRPSASPCGSRWPIPQSPKSWRPCAASQIYKQCSSARTTCIPSPCAPAQGTAPSVAGAKPL